MRVTSVGATLRSHNQRATHWTAGAARSHCGLVLLLNDHLTRWEICAVLECTSVQ